MVAPLRYHYEPPTKASRIDHVGTYRRRLPVSLDRMYENALDWEHLPHLHGGSFNSIQCLDSGGWGWRAEVADARGSASVLELCLDRDCRRWITRNLEGPNAGAEIWTHVFVVSSQLMDIVVDYFVPGVPVDSREKVGRAYAAAYEILYDEDVWMMSERQRQIDLRVDGPRDAEQLELSISQVTDLPKSVVLSGREFLLHRHNEAWVIYPAACPHQLGPLSTEISNSGEVECPWHGYRFDVFTGECTTGALCQFGKVPVIDVSDDRLVLSWPQPS